MAVSPAPATAVPSRQTVDLDRWLLRVTGFFAVAVVLHNGDHLRRGSDTVATDVFWLGSLGIVVEVLVVFVICQRHRLAPLAASVAGISLASGYVVVHFLPERSWFSDSFPSASDVSPLSWAAASIEVVAALALATAAIVVLRQRGGLASAARPHPLQRTIGDAMRHPLAATFAISQVITVAVSFSQR